MSLGNGQSGISHSYITILLSWAPVETQLWEAEWRNDSPSGPADMSKEHSISAFLSRSLALCCMTACWSALTQLTFLAPASCSGCSEKAKPCKTVCAALPFSATSQCRDSHSGHTATSTQVELLDPFSSENIMQHCAFMEIMYNQLNVPSVYNWKQKYKRWGTECLRERCLGMPIYRRMKRKEWKFHKVTTYVAVQALLIVKRDLFGFDRLRRSTFGKMQKEAQL